MKRFVGVLLKAYPASFRQAAGGEWESVAEALMEEARTKGGRAVAAVMIWLCLDTLLYAPKAHAQATWAWMSARQEDALLAMRQGNVLMLARRGVGRGWDTLGDAAWAGLPFFVLGASAYLARLAVVSWRYAQRMTEQAYSRSSDAVAGNLLGWGVGVLVVAWALPRAWRWFKQKGAPWKSGMVFFLMGMLGGEMVGGAVILGPVGAHAIEPFERFPHVRQSLHLPEYNTSGGVRVDAWYDAQGRLHPQVKQAWCANAMARLDMWQIALQGSKSGDVVIEGLLLNGLWTQVAEKGCLDDAQFLARHEAVARLAHGTNNYQDYLAHNMRNYSVLFSTLSEGRYLLIPQVHMTGEKFCMFKLSQLKLSGAALSSSPGDWLAYCNRYMDTSWQSHYPPLSQDYWGNRIRRQLTIWLTGRDPTLGEAQAQAAQGISLRQAQAITKDIEAIWLHGKPTRSSQ